MSERAALGGFLDEHGIGRMQQHDDRTGGRADDFVDQLECML
jgi:hypothetical protein